MTFNVLAVCSANVCRSPLAATLLDRALTGHLVRHHIQIRTCGLDAEPGAPACPVVTQSLARNRESRPALAEHRATLLSPAIFEQADLVLTADRHARAGVVRMFPQAHGRVFTMREAEQLSLQLQETLDPQGVAGVLTQDGQPRPDDMALRLREFVKQLDAQRGLGDLVRTHRWMTLSAPWRPLLIHGHDLPDAHLDHRVPHRLVLRLTEQAVGPIATAMCTFSPSSEQSGSLS